MIAVLKVDAAGAWNEAVKGIAHVATNVSLSSDLLHHVLQLLTHDDFKPMFKAAGFITYFCPESSSRHSVFTLNVNGSLLPASINCTLPFIS
ncbi:uncharacterized protein STEHIDRAFT_157250 [Stereum hirsutum FP-91666 SS1]|uniref:uncharacterized protein n=1 Tax=Stereum hirsutum (strain FP-91666) TaxID=721885 RepID=UPI000444A254|nr:uncharacterized protein STEHIDRAFT_157250 [Stereum hirsutum FP-91666 SS1]EIM86962.1 hypothetical protein STEHIDRAFT_157250 [Stereum hirsutum FP-91666 SS1]